GARADAALQHLAEVAPRDVRVLLRAGERELLLDDLLGQYEPGVLVAGLHDVRQRPERVEAGEERGGQPAPERVEPHGRRPGDGADPVVGPGRVPVADALAVVPPTVGV